MRRSRSARRFPATPLSLGIVLCLAGCAEPPPPVEVLRPVRAVTVEHTGGTRVRSFSGAARAGREIQLSFRVAGTIESLDARVGDRVRAGQRIAQLETQDYELQVQQAQANLSRSEAAERNAEANLDRIRGLWESRNASQNDLDAARASADSEAANVESNEKALEAAQRQLGYTTLTAPVDGAIASVPVEVNENVDGRKTVVTLTSGSRPEVELAIPGVVISRIHQGDTVTVTLSALPGSVFDAVVTEVGVAATGAATTFPVRVRLVEDNDAVRAGMSADVEFRFQVGGPDSIYLPSVAVGEDREGRFVFVLEPGEEPGVGVVRRRAVDVAEELSADGIRVLSGVQPGERVVTAGVRRLVDEQRVRSTEADRN
jgi:RND family efflux transporter MFP subunit